MKERISMDAHKEITKKQAIDYGKLNRAEKAEVITQLCKSCDWTRKHAIKALAKARKGVRGVVSCKVKTRKKTYGEDLRPIVVRIWYASGCQNVKSLYALLDVWYYKLKGKSTTKAGKLLRNAIKIRKAGDEQERVPGFIELDTVAHCGASLQGEFMRSLTATDVHTGWTENMAIRNNAHRNIEIGLNHIEKVFPFQLTGFDCDNGSEFINKSVIKWVSHRDLYFTRSRPYKKNDNAHVEQKNNDIVRRLAFYYRYDTHEELELLNKIYDKASLFYNFFRAIQKTNGYREDKKGHYVRRYDKPKTPYQRVLDSNVLSQEKETELAKLYKDTNPAQVIREIVSLQVKLIEIAKGVTNCEIKHQLLKQRLLDEVA